MSVNQLSLLSANTEDYRSQAGDPAASIFVSANAGSGKTSLLTDRVLALLLQGVDPSKILCLTYTKAAAAEMQQRVLQKLGGWVMAGEAELEKSIATILGRAPTVSMLRQARSLFASVLEAPDGVRIQTIHSFCQSVLRRFPLEAGISPNFTLMEDRSTRELLRQAQRALIFRADSSLGDSIRALAGRLSAPDFDQLLRDIAQRQSDFRAAFSGIADSSEIPRRVARDFGVSAEETPASLISACWACDAETARALRSIAETLQAGAKTDQATAQALLARLNGQVSEWERYRRAFVTDKGDARDIIYTKRTLTDPDAIALLLREQEWAVACAARLRSLASAQMSAHALCLAHGFLTHYEALKKQRGWMDYDDLIATTDRLLRQVAGAAWILYKLDGGIDHLLIDEAQDTSPRQWAIVQAICEDFFGGESRASQPRSLFVVGDEKQSIFSFQGAEVRLLGQMRRYFHDRIREAKQSSHALSLQRSYRSVPEVLAAVDAVFSAPDAAAGVASESVPTHLSCRADQVGLVECWPLLSGAYPMSMLARELADRIAGWLSGGLWIDGKARRATAGDILILVRTRTPFVEALARALGRRGVPVAGADRMRLSDNLAVQDLLALGECMLLPQDDLTLAALLKSPICDLREENILALAVERGGQSLWDRLGGEARERLETLRAIADTMPPFEFYSAALETLGARARMTGRMGEEYAEAIDEFLLQALAYQRAHPPSLQLFLRWMRAGEGEIKRDMEQAGDAVRIMTAHGAKGLQAPIVILPDTVSYPKMDERFFWPDGTLPVWSASSDEDDVRVAALRAEAKERMFEEYRRLLYVAMTRAEDHLYIAGALKEGTPPDDCWYSLIRRGMEKIAVSVETEQNVTLRVGPPARMDDRLPLARAQAAASTPPDMEWLRRPVAPESAVDSALSPSRLARESPPVSPSFPGVYARGVLMHRLLQYLPDVDPARRLEVAQACARHSDGDLSAEQRDACIKEAMSVIAHPDFAPWFAPGGLVEAPIAGMIMIEGERRLVSGQVDRLVVSDSAVWLVDYKTHRTPPASPAETPLPYLRQMALYVRLLREMFPEKPIHAALLWTAAPRMDRLDDASLAILE